MFCTNCGRPNPDDAKFCAFCGKLPNQPVAQSPSKRRLQSLLFVLATAFGLLVIILLIGLLLPANHVEQAQRTKTESKLLDTSAVEFEHRLDEQIAYQRRMLVLA